MGWWGNKYRVMFKVFVKFSRARVCVYERERETWETAHCAAAMAVLATVAALARLLSVTHTSLWERDRIQKDVFPRYPSCQAGLWGFVKSWMFFFLCTCGRFLYRFEPLANSTVTLFPSMDSEGWRAWRICSSWDASCGTNTVSAPQESELAWKWSVLTGWPRPAQVPIRKWGFKRH